MGHHGGKSDAAHYGGRAGAGAAKRDKETRRGRVPVTSKGDPTRKSFADAKKEKRNRGLDSLEARIRSITDAGQLEALYGEYAGKVNPPMLNNVAKYSDLENREGIRGIHKGDSGSKKNFLPLRHLARVLCSGPYDGSGNSSYAYVMGTSTYDPANDFAAEKNLRMLEQFLGTFAGRLSPGKCLSATINGRKVSVPFYDKWNATYTEEREECVQSIRKILQGAEISMSNDYALRNVVDGDHKLAKKEFHIATAAKVVYREKPSDKAVPVFMSYVAVKRL